MGLTLNEDDGFAVKLTASTTSSASRSTPYLVGVPDRISSSDYPLNVAGGVLCILRLLPIWCCFVLQAGHKHNFNSWDKMRTSHLQEWDIMLFLLYAGLIAWLEHTIHTSLITFLPACYHTVQNVRASTQANLRPPIIDAAAWMTELRSPPDFRNVLQQCENEVCGTGCLTCGYSAPCLLFGFLNAALSVPREIEVSEVSVCETIGASSLSCWLVREPDSTLECSVRLPPNSCDGPDTSVKCNSDFLETSKSRLSGNWSMTKQIRLRHQWVSEFIRHPIFSRTQFHEMYTC